MKDDDIDVVLCLIKKINKPFLAPFLDRLAAGTHTPFKILIACILSLRTRDSTAEEASTRLFHLAGDPLAMAMLPVQKITNAIYPVGFYRTKAKQIHEISEKICIEFQGKVPCDINELLRFSGVGRKTANLVRTVGYKKLGICVDVHVHRICNRLGFVCTKDPDDTEAVLREKLPRKYWVKFNALMVSFGQNQCTPVSPKCSSCLLTFYCEQKNVLDFR